MLAKVDIEQIEIGSQSIYLAEKISEFFLGFNASLDIDNWERVKAMAEKGEYQSFDAMAEQYLGVIQNKFVQVIKSMNNKMLNFQFGIPYDPLAQAMFTASNFAHLLAEQQLQNYPDSRWLLDSEIKEFGFELQPGATPVSLLVWNRSDLFNANNDTENYAFYIKVYNVSQVQNFPLKEKAALDLDLDLIIGQVNEIVEEYGFEINRLGIPYKNDSVSCADDVLFISKQSLPKSTLFCSSLNTKNQTGSEIVALIETLLQVEDGTQAPSDFHKNILGHVYGQSISNHLQVESAQRPYTGSYYLYNKIGEEPSLIHDLTNQIIINHNIALDGLRKINSTIPFSMYNLVKESSLLNRQDVRAVLLNRIIEESDINLIKRTVSEINHSVDTTTEYSYLDRFMEQLKAQFTNDPELLSDLLDGRERLVETAFNQLMDDRSSYSEELSTEAYFRAVSSTLASNLYTRIKKLNMIEKDWLQHLESQMSDCHNIAIREDRLKKAALIKSTNDEVNKFIDGSLIKANFTISTIDEQYNEFKKKLH